jgi:hypothetical protein
MSWKIILANTKTLESLAQLDQARDVSLTLTLNSPGNASFSMPIIDEKALLISPIETCVMFYRDDQLIWSGPIWTTDESLPEARINVTAVGWFELLNHRLLSADVSYTNIDAGTIASNLLADANGQYQTLITIGTIESSQPRTRAYKKYQNIGQEIKALSEVESGFDYLVTPDTRTLNIYAERKTITDVVFEYQSNLSSLERTFDGSTVTNRIWALGNGLTGTATDFASLNEYGLFEESTSLSEISDSQIIGAFCNAEIAIKKTPREIINLLPFPWTEGNNVPRIFDDYQIGDVVYVTASYGTVQIERKACRIFGASISISAEGNERISQIQTTPS